MVVVESSNGLASTTLNAGIRPGSVNIRVELYEVDEENMITENMIAWAQAIMVVIQTGPPAYGEINFALQETVPINGGLYEIPFSVALWDLNANPVADSTNVWLTLFPDAPPWHEDSTYVFGQRVMWGTDAVIDSLVYECNSIDTLFPGNPDYEPPNEEYWTLVQHPAFCTPEAKTGMENPWGSGEFGNAFPGVAWGAAYYTSNTIFHDVILKAQTFFASEDEEITPYFIVDSRANHNGQPTMLPFYPGVLTISVQPAFHDFSVGPNHSNNGCLSREFMVSTTLIDFYNENIDGGQVLLYAIGGTILETPPQFEFTDPFWIPGAIQITDVNGAARWYFQYPIELCPRSDPQTCPIPDLGPDEECLQCDYDDFSSSVWLQLLDPQQVVSSQMEVTLMRSGGECEDCPAD